MKEIILNRIRPSSPDYRKFTTMVDNEDFEKVNKFNWSALRHGNTIYVVRRGDNGKNMYLHKYLTGLPNTDHIDGNGLNNTRDNLRRATHQQNGMNRKPNKNSTTEFKGIYWQKDRKKWHSQIKLNGKSIFLGLFNSKTEAAQAYNNKAKELFGEFARLNIIKNPATNGVVL